MNKLKSLFKKDKDTSSESTQSSVQPQNTPSGGAAIPTATTFPPNNAPSTGLEHADNAQGVVLHTTLGDITIALFSQETPRVYDIVQVSHFH